MTEYDYFGDAYEGIVDDFDTIATVLQPEMMQDIWVYDRPEFMVQELRNYNYTVLDPELTEIQGVHESFVSQEHAERLIGDLNPGTSWKQRKEVWEPLLEEQKVGGQKYGSFSYAYSERMGGQHIDRILEEISRHPTSRQLWLPVWSNIDETRRGDRRVPCTLGYQFLVREGRVHMTHIMRSCDFVTHYPNDVALATLLMRYVASESGLDPGSYTHFIGSFHRYSKDVEGEF